MRPRLLCRALLIVLASACAGHASHDRTAPQRHADSVPVARPSVFHDIRSEVAPLDESRALPPALGIPDLRVTPASDGDRELRAWFGLVAGYPHDGLIVQVRKGEVTGRLVRYWPPNDSAFAHEPEPGEDALDADALYSHHENGRCERIGRSTDGVACFVRLRREPDWHAVLAILDSANAWTLPDESTLKRRGMVLHGWRLRVEARTGSEYRRYQYTNAGYVQPPEGPHAHRIGVVVDSLMHHFAAPSAAYRAFKGHYAYGRDTSDFAACGTGELVAMGMDRSMLIALLQDSTLAQEPTRRFYVEGWGTVGPERLQRRGKRLYPRHWSADTFTVARTPSPADCRP